MGRVCVFVSVCVCWKRKIGVRAWKTPCLNSFQQFNTLYGAYRTRTHKGSLITFSYCRIGGCMHRVLGVRASVVSPTEKILFSYFQWGFSQFSAKICPCQVVLRVARHFGDNFQLFFAKIDWFFKFYTDFFGDRHLKNKLKKTLCQSGDTERERQAERESVACQSPIRFCDDMEKMA